jgi:hypothetical protein
LPGGVVAEYGDIDLVGCPVLGVVDHSRPDPSDRAARDIGRGVVLDPVSADLLESRSDDAASEPARTVPPDLRRQPAPLQAAPCFLRPQAGGFDVGGGWPSWHECGIQVSRYGITITG